MEMQKHDSTIGIARFFRNLVLRTLAMKQAMQTKIKSNIIIIPYRLNKPPVTIETNLISTLILQTSTASYLETTIDSKLKFRNHILSLNHKILRTTGIFSKLSQFLPQSALFKVYYALIQVNSRTVFLSGARLS